MIPTVGFKAIPLSLAQLSLEAVLKCGQSFRWACHDLPTQQSDALDVATQEYRLALADRVICLRQTPKSLLYCTFMPGQVDQASDAQEAETLVFIRDYFQLDVDLVSLYETWSLRDNVFQRTVRERFKGIRMLRQDPWENLVSFIVSQNNNIKRISNLVQTLCTEFSPALLSLPDPMSNATRTYHPFPPPHALSAPSTTQRLRDLGFGYRAPYIQKTAQMLCEMHPSQNPREWLNTLRSADLAQARLELLKFPGVGPKVADCVLLMSLDKPNVVPVDTHVHQIAMKYYGMKGSGGKVAMNSKIYAAVSSKLEGVWGEYAGWAHSVLFTADLKAFANYGLDKPSPRKPSPVKEELQGRISSDVCKTPDSPAPSASNSPRKRKLVEDPDDPRPTSYPKLEREFMTMVERVKARTGRPRFSQQSSVP